MGSIIGHRIDRDLRSPFLLPITPRASLLSQERRLRTSQSLDLLRGGARDGPMLRALAFHQCGPGSILGVKAIIMRVEFVVGSLLFTPGTPILKSEHS